MWIFILKTLEEYHRFAFVAEDELARVIGFILGGPEPQVDPEYAGQLQSICVLKKYQRQGIGRQLTQFLVAKLVEMDMTSMLAWVLAPNPACHFFEALGGKWLRAHEVEMCGAKIEAVYYGWEDIRR